MSASVSRCSTFYAVCCPVDGPGSMKSDKTKKGASASTEGGIFQELWDRQVVHTFLIYLGSSWGISSFISLVINHYGLSPKVLDVSYNLILIGLPAAVTIAFFHGRTGKQKVPPAEFAILSLLFVIAAVLTVRSVMAPTFVTSTVPEVVEKNSPEPNSIAVLYFDNMSADGKDQYLSDGITEDIITGLTVLKAFQVPPRAAVLKYKDEPVDIRQLREELRVASVLEGSVRRAGNRLRITAQLFDTETGFHIWAESFDKEFEYKDVFDILDEVTDRIVKVLEVKLEEFERETRRRKPTDNIEAYDHYLRGKYHFYRYTREENEKAITSFRRAFELDETFAEAYAGAADALSLAYHRYWDRSPETIESAIEYALKAIRLNDQIAEAHAALGLAYLVKWYGEQDSALLEKAEQSLREALELDPGCDRARLNLVRILNKRGDYDESVELIEGVTDEALRGYSELLLGDIFRARGALDSALVHYNGSLMWLEDSTGTLNKIGLVHQKMGQYQEALYFFEKSLSLNPDHPTMLYNIARTLLAVGRYEEADSVTERAQAILPDEPDLEMLRAQIAAMAGDRAGAVEWLEKSIRSGYTKIDSVAVDPYLQGIVDLPGIPELLDQSR